MQIFPHRAPLFQNYADGFFLLCGLHSYHSHTTFSQKTRLVSENYKATNAVRKHDAM